MRALLLLLLTSVAVGAATYYVRDGGDGSTPTSSWVGAYDQLSSAETAAARGDTIYVADGSYTGVTCNTAASATTLITIKKATVADHGTGTGWSDTYGDGVATFSSDFAINSPYWLVDGQVGVGDGSTVAYGFKIATGEGGNPLSFASSNSTVRYIECQGISNLGDYNYSTSTTVVYFGNCSNITVSHCYLHGGDSLMYMGDGTTTNGWDSTGLTIEYNWMQASRSSNPSFHSNVVYVTGSENGIFRYNYCYNYNDEGLFFTWWEGQGSGTPNAGIPRNWEIYGNVFNSGGGPSGPTNPRGIEIRQFDSGGSGHRYDNIVAYNNTFVNLGVGGFLNRADENGNGSSSGCAFVNNLGYTSPNTVGDTATVSNNTADSTNRFVNLGGNNFHLTAALAGTALSAPYNKDMDGVTRGADGVWDRGAFEYVVPGSGIVNCGTVRVTNLRVGQ